MNLDELRRRRAAAIAEARALYDAAAAANRVLTDEENQRFDALMAEQQTLQRDITRLEELAGIEASLAESRTPPTRPALTAAPGAPVANPTTFRSLGEQCYAVYRAALEPHRTDPRLIESRATGMGEGIPADGGFLVQTEQTTTLLEKMYSVGEISRRVKPHPVGPNANGIAIPMEDETSRADGSRRGGIRGYWSGEGATLTGSRPKFGKFRLDLDKITALVYATDEMLQDVPFLDSYLNRIVPEELSFKLEDGIVNGSGAGMPLGLLSAAATVSVAKETGQAAATILPENIVKMVSRLWARSMQNAVWFVNQDVFPQLYLMSLAVGTGGVPVWMPAGGLSGSPYSTLFGRPVIPVEYCATLGTVGDIILADLNEYVLIDKGGVQAASSIHVQFLTDETTFRFTYRVNGKPWWPAALTPKNGTATQSPFITLATRA